MGWFGGKPRHEQTVESVLQITGKLYETLADPHHAALRFRRPDSRFRCLFFSLSTVHGVCASRMKNPDAVLNECAHCLVKYALAEQDTFFGGEIEPQRAANAGGAYLQDYLNRWSSYIDIRSSGNQQAARSVVSSMLADIESAQPVAPGDSQRLGVVVSWIEGKFDDIHSAVK